MTPREPLLQISGLRIAFGAPGRDVEVVHGVDLSIAPGSAMGLVGESGSGKSVTAHAVMNLLRPPGRVTAGSIRLGGDELLGCSEAEWRGIRGKRIAMIFQDPLSALTPSMRVGEQVAEALVAHGTDWPQARTRAVELLDLVGIPRARERARAFPHEFSGGMRQRVVIAAALANDPELLIADEPTTALDVTVQAQILKHLSSLREELNLTTLFITHDLGIVAEFCDDVAVMRHGELVERAGVDTLYTTPREAYTRALLDAVPRVDAPPAREGAPLASVAPLLQVEDLRVDVAGRRGLLQRREPHFAVDGVSLSIAPGETLGLVGESGCGKSTLSRAISGLTPVTAGRVLLDGVDVTRRGIGEPERRVVQYVFQDAAAALNPLRTVRQSLEEARAASADASAPRVGELMELVGLHADMLDRRPSAFSGGQRQRIGIARALAASPRLLLCDEPVSALDVSVQAQIIALLERLRDDLGLALLFIAHDLAVVKHLSDRVAVMQAGVIVESGPVAEVYGSPRHAYTQRLLAASPIPEVGAARAATLARRAEWSVR